jgi:hypothetical protein
MAARSIPRRPAPTTTPVRREAVPAGVDVRHDRVEAEVDVSIGVPRVRVDRDGGLGELALRELLDQDPVVQGLALVCDDGDIGVRRLLAERLGRGRPRDAVADDHIRLTHIRHVVVRG